MNGLVRAGEWVPCEREILKSDIRLYSGQYEQNLFTAKEQVTWE